MKATSLSRPPRSPLREGGPSATAAFAPYAASASPTWSPDGLRDEGLPSDRRRDLLTFTVSGEEYALGIEWLREIIKTRPITEVPRVPPFVAGIIAVRGVVMPVIDLRLRLRLPAKGLSPRARILVVTRPPDSRDEQGREPFGLIVDQVHQVVRLREQDVELSTMLSGHEAEFISGIGRLPLEEGADARTSRGRRLLGGAVRPEGARPPAPEQKGPAQRRMLILLDLQRVLTFDLSSEAAHGREALGAGRERGP